MQDQSLCADCTATISTLLYQEPSLLETQRLRGSPWGGRTPGICSLFDAESGLQSAGGRWAGLNILRPLLRSWVVYSHTPSPRHMSSPFISSIHWYSAAGRQFERRFFGSFTKDAFHLTCLPVWLSPHMARSWTALPTLGHPTSNLATRRGRNYIGRQSMVSSPAGHVTVARCCKK